MPNDKPDAASRRHLHLGYAHVANGDHSAGWRYPGAEHARAFDPDYVVDLARTAEEAKFDFFFLDDSLSSDTDDQYTDTSLMASLEAFTTAAYLGTLTNRIGLVVTADSAYYEPFNLARLTASLDYVSHGRASWNVAAGADPRAARNYSLPGPSDEISRYARADEFVDLVRALWDSWEDDAYVRNKETGEFVDGSKIHPVDHAGEFFHVRGPLNVARPPQGQPLLLHEVTSERARQFAARHADIVIANLTGIEEGQAFSADIRRRAVEIGRDPGDIFVLAPLTAIVASTFAEARSLYDELNSLLVPSRNHRGQNIGTEPGRRIVLGGPQDIADRIESWFALGAVDGFVVRPAFLTQQLTVFADLVVPELARRGLFRTEYEGSTLRDHFGLSRPNDNFTSRREVSVA